VWSVGLSRIGLTKQTFPAREFGQILCLVVMVGGVVVRVGQLASFKHVDGGDAVVMLRMILRFVGCLDPSYERALPNGVQKKKYLRLYVCPDLLNDSSTTPRVIVLLEFSF
jgi:hypothetical protein